MHGSGGRDAILGFLAYTRDEMVAGAPQQDQLRNGAVCFVGIGLPSAACNLARLQARTRSRADL